MGSGFQIKNGELVIRLNPKVYSLERVYATAYIFLDKYFFILDGDKEKEILVIIKPKDKNQNLEEFAHKFFEEILSITNYFNQLEKNKDVINMIIKRALFSLTLTELNKAEKEEIEKKQD